MATYTYKYLDKPVRLFEGLPLAEDVGGALSQPSSTVIDALNAVGVSDKITVPLRVIDNTIPLDDVAGDALVTVLTPTGVTAFITRLALSVAVSVAVSAFLDGASRDMLKQRRRRRRSCPCV
jgi:hypothetical protein